MATWTAEIWIAAIGGITAIVTAAIALLKPKSQSSPKSPPITVRFDSEHVPTSELLKDIRRIADAKGREKE